MEAGILVCSFSYEWSGIRSKSLARNIYISMVMSEYDTLMYVEFYLKYGPTDKKGLFHQ